MKDLVLLALRRRLAMQESAGMVDKAKRTAAQIAEHEAKPEPVGTTQETADEPAGVEVAPAGEPLLGGPAQARADELGLTPEDFVGQEPSGKGGKFLVGDVERIAAARNTETTDGDYDVS